MLLLWPGQILGQCLFFLFFFLAPRADVAADVTVPPVPALTSVRLPHVSLLLAQRAVVVLNFAHVYGRANLDRWRLDGRDWPGEIWRR